MKKFTKIIEKLENIGYYKVDAQVQLILQSENEGEAGYIGDSILGSIKEQTDYTISNIEEKNENDIDLES